MINRQNFILLAVFGLMFFAGGVFNNAFGQSVTPNNSYNQEENGTTIKQLLDEVRELRLVLQKNSSTAQRAQILMERVRLQQQRVDSLVKEQESVRQKAKELERNIPRAVETAAHWERSIELATTPSERADREQATKDLKGDVERYKKEFDETRERDAQLAARIQAEQAKLDELNTRLDAIEREMESAPADTPKTNSKRS